MGGDAYFQARNFDNIVLHLFGNRFQLIIICNMVDNNNNYDNDINLWGSFEQSFNAI